MPNFPVDKNILEALGLDEADTTMTAHGGSGFTSTYKITSTKDDKPVKYFIKIGTGPKAATMLKGEAESLNAIHSAVPNLCPKAHSWGDLHSGGKFYMATDFLELGSSAPGGSGLSLATKLAQLHSTPAPIPEGHDRPMFGFPLSTCCGSTPQDNAWRDSWAEFYAENRLRHILAAAVRNNGEDPELERTVELVAAKVVPRLIGDDHVRGITPVVVHGDLWSGNHSRGQIAGEGGCEEVVYDPAAVYGHAEYELGIMKMFGGFSSHFWGEYQELMPKAEPVDEWEDRVKLYELYHHLNHCAIFGEGYRGGAMSIMKRLISKYGN